MNITRLPRGGNVVHAMVAPDRTSTSYRVLFCDGRGVRSMVGTLEPVTCKRCLKTLTEEKP